MSFPAGYYPAVLTIIQFIIYYYVWTFGRTLYVCCVFSQPRVCREHGGAWWRHRCYTEPSQLHLPTHTGRPLQPADGLFYFTAIYAGTLNSFSFFLHLYIISDNNILDSLSAKHGKPPWFDVLSAKLCFWSLFPYITHHCVFVFKVEMVNPVKNKKCNHHYDEGAILGLIKTRQSQKKKCR